MEEMWRVLEVVGEVEGLESSEGDYSAHCQVISNLLSFFFNCIILQCGKEGTDTQSAISLLIQSMQWM